MNTFLLVVCACVLAVACGGVSTEVDDTHSMHPDDRMAMTDGDDMMAMEPEPIVEVPVIRPVGEDPSEDEEVEPTRQERDDEAAEAPEVPMPVAPEPAVTPEPEDAAEEPEPKGIMEPTPAEMPEPVMEPTSEPTEETPYKLVIQFNGPPEQEIHAGATDQFLFQFSLTATEDVLTVEGLGVGIQCDGGLHGSVGTPYFTDITLVDMETGAVLIGPRELAPPIEEMRIVSSWFVLEDVFEISAGDTRRLTLTADIAAFEDASGEFFGHTCRVTLASLEGFVSVGSPPATLPNEAMNITEDISGNPFTVSAAAWGAFSFCDAGSGSEGCCTTGGFARDMAEVHSGMFVKSQSSPSVYYVGSDMERSVFPTRMEFYSWLGWDERGSTEVPTLCANIREFSDEMIASLPIRGSIGVRPGTYLLVSASSDTLYVVGRRSTLHAVGSWAPTGCASVPASGDPGCGEIAWLDGMDAVREAIPDAEARVRIVADGWFGLYLFGDPAVAYDPMEEYDWGSPNTLEAELGLLATR